MMHRLRLKASRNIGFSATLSARALKLAGNCLSGFFGTANLFMMFAPLEGWRHVKVTERRRAIDYAHALKDLSDVHFPDAKTIVLVQDNLNTHTPASLY